MGNKQAVQEDSPWASVAKAANDTRAKDARALGGPVSTQEVKTTAMKLPGTVVYSTMQVSEETLSFKVQLSEPCALGLKLDDIIVESAIKTFDSVAQHDYSTHLKLKHKEHRVEIDLKPVSDPSRGTLKVVLLIKNDRVLIVSKQAELGGNVVVLEDVYGIGAPKECVICLTDTSDATFVPCRHMCTCLDCANTLLRNPDPSERKCPICRKGISNIVKVTANSSA